LISNEHPGNALSLYGVNEKEIFAENSESGINDVILKYR
jgi:hypothetical protein